MLLYVTFFGIPLTQARDYRCGQIGISSKYRLVLFDLTITLSNIAGPISCVSLYDCNSALQPIGLKQILCVFYVRMYRAVHSFAYDAVHP